MVERINSSIDRERLTRSASRFDSLIELATSHIDPDYYGHKWQEIPLGDFQILFATADGEHDFPHLEIMTSDRDRTFVFQSTQRGILRRIAVMADDDFGDVGTFTTGRNLDPDEAERLVQFMEAPHMKYDLIELLISLNPKEIATVNGEAARQLKIRNNLSDKLRERYLRRHPQGLDLEDEFIWP